MRKILLALLIIAFLLLGCDKNAKKIWHSPHDFLADVYTADGECDPGSLVKPTHLTPYDEQVVTTTDIELSWDFTGCDVWQFTIDLAKGTPIFNPPESYQIDMLENDNSYHMDPWYLSDCETYFWRVTGHGDTNYVSDIAIFSTDFYGTCPVEEDCTEGPPQPIALLPTSYMLHTPNPQLIWMDSDPACAVENYHFEVSREPDFSLIDMEGDTTDHSYSQTEPYLLEDCTDYFWRVTAEANGQSKVSNVLEIGTNFTGSCQHTFCEEADLTAAQLILPAQGAVVTSSQPQFLWSDNLAVCHPHSFDVNYGTDPTMTTFSTQFVPGHQVTWTPASDQIFQNCTTYYWNIVAWSLMGDSITSATGVFTTDFGGTICGSPNMPPVPLAMLNSFSLGCVDSSRMWAIYDFKGPVVGQFEAHASSKLWPCGLVAGTTNELMCFGAMVPQQTNTVVDLYPVGGDEPVLTEEAMSPQCVGPLICQPPAEGCSPLTSRDPAGGLIIIPTHWDLSKCLCVP